MKIKRLVILFLVITTVNSYETKRILKPTNHNLAIFFIAYDADDTSLTGKIYNISVLELTIVNRNLYGGETDYKQDIVEVIGIGCCISASGYCVINCIKILTGKDYKQPFLTVYKR